MSRKNRKSFNWNEVDETGTKITKKPAPQFNLRTINPLTSNQDLTFKTYESGSNLMLHGVAGTGKTFISMYLALREILSGSSSYEKIVVIRSVVPVRDLGHMPGKLEQKIGLYEEPYKEICDDLFSNGQGYNILKAKKLVEFTSTSYLRGITYNNCIIVVDEVQNMTEMEIHTVMTRVGKDSKIIICGDYNQKDYMKESSGINTLFKITKKMKSFAFINFGTTDIVRSGFVKEYLLAKIELETAGEL